MVPQTEEAAPASTERAIPYGFAEEDYTLDALSDEDHNAPKAPVRAKWDCATIVSTYTNTENHPTLVVDEPLNRKKKPTAVIKLSAKTGMPIPVVREGDGSEDEGDGGDSGSDGSEGENGAAATGSGVVVPPRSKNETAEEKRLRKAATKEARRVRAHID